MTKEYQRRSEIFGLAPEHGPIILHDNMEDLLKWTKGGTGGDDILELSSSIAFHKSQSLYMKTRTTDAAENDAIFAIRSPFIPPSRKINALIVFHSPDFTKIKTIDFSYGYYDGTRLHNSAISYVPATPTLTYLDPTGTPQTIADSGLNLEEYGGGGQVCWHRLAYSTDFARNKYISAELNHLIFDLSALDSRNVENEGPYRLETTIYIYTAGASPAELYVDSLFCHET